MAGLASAIYSDAQLYDALAKRTAPADGSFWRRCAKRYGAPILELGCGTGRVALPLAAEGHTLVGIETAPALLERARDRAAAAGLPVLLHEADFRAFDLGQTFPLVIVPYNAFNHLLVLEDVRDALASIRRHLAPGGTLVIDTFQPDPLRLMPNTGKVELLTFHDESERRIVLFEQNRYDAAAQINHITWTFDIDGVAGALVAELAMRIFFPQELEALLTLHGYRIVEKYGDYGGGPFRSAAPKQLVVAVCDSMVP